MQSLTFDKKPTKPLGKLQGKIVLITGDDLSTGRKVAILCAREGADIIINYLPKKQKEAADMSRFVRAEGCRCYMVPGNLEDIAASKVLIEKSLKPFGRIDILINSRSAAEAPIPEWQEQSAPM